MTLRTPMAWVLPIVGWVFCLVFAVNLVLTGTPITIARFLPWLGLVAWALYLVLWRPRLVVTANRVEIVNLLRTHVVPLADVVSYRVMQTVTVETRQGRIASWGAPGVSRASFRTSRAEAETGTGGPFSSTQRALDERLAAWRAQGGSSDRSADGAGGAGVAARVQWAVPAIVIGGILVVACLVTLFL